MTRYSPLKHFFEVASPATLASLIKDIEGFENGQTMEMRELKAMARVELDSLVGAEEANELIAR